MRKKVALTLLVFCSLFSSCGLVVICRSYPSDSDIANAYKHPDQIPLTAEDMKHLLLDDTTHYKVVVFYSVCCGPCLEQMRDTYSKIYDIDTANVRWYFVLENCSSVKYDAGKLLRKYGIVTPYMYYLRAEDSNLRADDEDYLWNLAQYVFGELPELEDVMAAIPNAFVVSPQGQLKTEYHKYADGSLLLGNFHELYKLVYGQTYPDMIPYDTPVSVRNLRFDEVDTVDYTIWGEDIPYRKPKVCTPDGCQ